MSSFLRALNRPVVAIAAVAIVAGGLRFYNLDYPPSRVFDEVYYSKSACVYLGYSNKRCDVASNDEIYWVKSKGETGSWVHPPLGKWAIALGEKLAGTGPLGWRLSAAAFGTATVVIIAIIAQLLFGSPLWTFVAGLLLATEFLELVQSRVAMLDIFLAFWVALGFLLLLLDRRWIERRTLVPEPALAGNPGTPDEPMTDERAGLAETEPVPVPSPFLRPWRLAAGVALGAAVATKWSGLSAIGGAILLSILWEVVRRRRAGVRDFVFWTIAREGFPLAFAFVIVPALVYIVSYSGWFLKFGFSLHDWLKLQGDMASYQIHLKGTAINPDTGLATPIHPYLSPAWKWLLVWRPVLYFAKYPGRDLRHVILALGSPAIFWGSLLAIPYIAVAWRIKRDWRAGYVLVAILAQYVPWFVVSRPQFFFYVTPIVPFLVLADTYAIRDLSEVRIAGSRSRPYLPIAAGFVVVSVALFVWFWPVLTGAGISSSAWKLRIWFPSWV